MKFYSHKCIIEALLAWAIERGYSYKLTKNTKSRIIVVCEDSCGFKIHASRYKDTFSFQIKTFMAEHSCLRKTLGHMVNCKYIATRYLEDIRDAPNWDASTMQKRISIECGADVHISKCYYNRRYKGPI